MAESLSRAAKSPCEPCGSRPRHTTCGSNASRARGTVRARRTHSVPATQAESASPESGAAPAAPADPAASEARTANQQHQPRQLRLPHALSSSPFLSFIVAGSLLCGRLSCARGAGGACRLPARASAHPRAIRATSLHLRAVSGCALSPAPPSSSPNYPCLSRGKRVRWRGALGGRSAVAARPLLLAYLRRLLAPGARLPPRPHCPRSRLEPTTRTRRTYGAHTRQDPTTRLLRRQPSLGIGRQPGRRRRLDVSEAAGSDGGSACRAGRSPGRR